MDIKKYEVLLHTIDKGSFLRACEDLGYTQSGITHMMNNLENEIGFPLLQRSNKGVQLTPEGKKVLPTIRELVNFNNKLNQEIDLIKGLETGKVRIGSFVTVACAWLPRVIQTFQGKYPGIQIELFEENSIWRLEEWLQEGFIDICFFSKQPYHTFEWIDLKKDPYLAVVPSKHPLAKQEQVPVEAFVEESFLMFRSLDGPDRDISSYFKRIGIPLKSKYSCSSDFSVVFMIEHNLGISMMPELILEKIIRNYSINVVTKPLFPPLYRQLGLAVRSFQNISPAMERFIKCTKDVLLKKSGNG
ncbi:LysR family transcriptional regulator [Sporomusa aerivorans]|uniref:LysR family transcriptional regulator n=1 Tax=Sporomusa aerivorans TaxID=204936 RepID=UPI00352A7E98